MGWDFEAEDCFTNQFDSSIVKLSTSQYNSQVLKMTVQKNGQKNLVQFAIPELEENETIRIAFRAMLPRTNSVQGELKVQLK